MLALILFYAVFKLSLLIKQLAPLLFTKVISLSILCIIFLAVDGLYVHRKDSNSFRFSDNLFVTFITQPYKTCVYILNTFILRAWANSSFIHNGLRNYLICKMPTLNLFNLLNSLRILALIFKTIMYHKKLLIMILLLTIIIISSEMHILISSLSLSMSVPISTTAKKKKKADRKTFSYYNLLEDVHDDTEIFINKEIFIDLINNFWKDVFSRNKDRLFLLQIQAHSDDIHRSLTKLHTMSFDDKEEFMNIILDRYDIFEERYIQIAFKNITVRYLLLEENSSKASKYRSELKNKSVKLNPLSANGLPIQLDLKKWGKIISESPSLVLISRDKYLITVSITDNLRTVQILNNNNVIIEFKDQILSLENDHFIREMNGYAFLYKNNLLMNTTHKQEPTVFMKKAKKEGAHDFTAITLDLETRKLKNNSLEVISAVFFDGENYLTYFLTDYKSSNLMIIQMLKDLLNNSEYNGRNIYVHNLSNFDGVFLLTGIVEYVDDISIVRKDDKIISIKMTKNDVLDRNSEKDNEKVNVKLTLIDSLSLLPASLKKLGKSFNVSQKGEFDHERSNTTSNLEVIRDELLMYNKQDCLVLFEVLKKFSIDIFDLFKVNIEKIPTISSLALHIYRSNFMPDEAEIPISDYKLYQLLRSGYTGGAVDVYKPTNPEGKKVYVYDINSLYPFVMKNYYYPSGSPKLITGHVDIHDPKIFGFVYVDVTAPDNLDVPLLQVRIKGKTVAPVGNWCGWYFTEELKYAEQLGYKFTVKKAILFGKSNFFFDYVEKLYTLRKSFKKSDPKNLICKLLLNSLYGKFALNPKLSNWFRIDNTKEAISEAIEPMKNKAGVIIKDSLTLYDDNLELINHDVQNILEDVIELNSKALISKTDFKNCYIRPAFSKEAAIEILAKRHDMTIEMMTKELDREDDEYYYKSDLKHLMKDKCELNISLPISMAITAYARMHIYKFKRMVGSENLLYSDTDSIFTLKPLPDNMISDELGFMKLEYVADNAVFLAPKVYALQNATLPGSDRGVDVIKIKGSKSGHGLTFLDFIKLLEKNYSISIRQEKWNKNISLSTIFVKDSPYNLKITDNKRAIIWHNNKFANTKPYKLNKDNTFGVDNSIE